MGDIWLFMKRWSEDFLNSVSLFVNAEVNRLVQPVCIDFNAKLKRLKANVILSNFIDRDEFDIISWDDMVDKSTESHFLKKIRQSLDIMATTSMGKDILSAVCSSTYFGVAPMKQTGYFFDRSFPTVFLRASDDVFKNSQLILKILTHECTHAKNVKMEERAKSYMLPPRLLFMKCVMNEMSAYLSEDIVVQQAKNPNKPISEPTIGHIFNLLDYLADNAYMDDFSERIMRMHKKDVLKSDRNSFQKGNLTVFANYFKMHPMLFNLAVINRLYQIYQHRVIKKARHQWSSISTPKKGKVR